MADPAETRTRRHSGGAPMQLTNHIGGAAIGLGEAISSSEEDTPITTPPDQLEVEVATADAEMQEYEFVD